MSAPLRLVVVNDLHYPGAQECARGDDYEFTLIHDRRKRRLARWFRNAVWQRHPTRLPARLHCFLAAAGQPDAIIVNGDLAYDGASLGLADDATRDSATECLRYLRAHFGDRLHVTLGDHELGKVNWLGGHGGLRLASWQAAVKELDLSPFWQFHRGDYVAMGVTSTLVALPTFQRDPLPEETGEWSSLRTAHLAAISASFDALKPHQRVLLFCHDPTALPFLAALPAVRRRLPQVAATCIGHLHTRLVYWKSRVLAGMPVIRFLGSGVQRVTTTLRQAREWRPFRLRFVPALCGTALFEEPSYLQIELPVTASAPVQFTWHRLPPLG